MQFSFFHSLVEFSDVVPREFSKPLSARIVHLTLTVQNLKAVKQRTIHLLTENRKTYGRGFGLL